MERKKERGGKREREGGRDAKIKCEYRDLLHAALMEDVDFPPETLHLGVDVLGVFQS